MSTNLEDRPSELYNRKIAVFLLFAKPHQFEFWVAFGAQNRYDCRKLRRLELSHYANLFLEQQLGDGSKIETVHSLCLSKNPPPVNYRADVI